MPDEHLTSDEDVEKILRIAVNLPGGAGTADLRSRLESAAEEMGISPEQLAQAEHQYATEKDHKEAMEIYAKEQRAAWVSNLLTYLGFTAFFMFLDWNGDHIFNWFWWPTFAWGIGVVIHGFNVINRRSEIYTRDFRRWKRKRDRKRGVAVNDDEDADLQGPVEAARRLRGVHIIAGPKLISPKLEITDWTKQKAKEEKEENQVHE